MDSKYINSLFFASKNSELALEELTNDLFSYGKTVAKNIIISYSISSITVDDLEDYILYTINYIYNTYKKSKKDFTDFAKYVLFKRLTSRVIEMCKTIGFQAYSLDEVLEDGTSLYELIPNTDSTSIPDQISYDEIHLRMSQPRVHDEATELKKKKLYSMQKAGYSAAEIIKALKVTHSQYRYLKKLVQDDFDDYKFKMEVK